VRSVAVVVEGGGGRGCWPYWGREKHRKKREEEKILGTKIISSPKWTRGDPVDGQDLFREILAINWTRVLLKKIYIFDHHILRHGGGRSHPMGWLGVAEPPSERS
jgi:hypothetical protein